MSAAIDECTYCGTGDELGVARSSVFADEWFPEDTSWSVVRPGVPACGICARDVREVQRRLWLAWGQDVAHANASARGITRRVLVAQQCAAWRGGSLARAATSLAADDSGVDPLDVEVMTRRLVRALYRWETSELLPLDAAIQSVQLSRERPSDMLRTIAAQGLECRELRPGIAYWFARAADSDCTLWYVAIWSRIFLFAKTLRR
jgi:hypothetical protein